jgi:hypothetical protein
MTTQLRALVVVFAFAVTLGGHLRGARADGSDAPDPTAGMSPATMHAICAKALNADPKLAAAVVDAVNEDTKQQHLDAAEHIAKNERHVIGAYAAMWLVSAVFLIFLWLRQRALRTEIERLRGDLAAAVADDKATT